MGPRHVWSLLDPGTRWFFGVLAFGVPLILLDFTLMAFDPVWLKALRHTLAALFTLYVCHGAWRAYRARWDDRN